MESDEQRSATFFLDGWYVFDNFAPFQIEWRGKLYPTAEHAYQAAHFFDTSPETAELVRKQLSPRLAADIANMHSQLDNPNWENIKVSIMEEIVRAKYEQHEYVRQVLSQTGTMKIIEANENDGFWGWGSDHKGRNELGKIWMRLREEVHVNED